MLTVFFVFPFGIMIVVSFFRRIEGSFYEPAFVLDNYGRFLSVFFGSVLGFSLFLAGLVAAICVAVGLPFTYLLTRMPRRLPGGWLGGLLPLPSPPGGVIRFALSNPFSP